MSNGDLNYQTNKENLNNMSHLLAPQIVILREGTDDHEGRGQIVSNINACQAVVDVIKTTLGKYCEL
jgi:hypothetical protein